uniref:Uncharacterized protein n=1 Tax=Ananas comosus var. bracteatus TaxID=296719 RepID=A0A6V7QH34_ANACO|nr:unnamed protein product [Ananas comosus var. bracteatus]
MGQSGRLNDLGKFHSAFRQIWKSKNTQHIVNDSQINLERIQIQSDANHLAEFSTTQDTGQSSASSCTNKKKARGESHNLKLLLDFPKGRVLVEFKNGKPIGDSAQYLITEIGVVLKNPYNAPLNVKCWDDIDNKKKKRQDLENMAFIRWFGCGAAWNEGVTPRAPPIWSDSGTPTDRRTDRAFPTASGYCYLWSRW